MTKATSSWDQLEGIPHFT